MAKRLAGSFAALAGLVILGVSPGQAADLSLKRVVLSTGGVGYFEYEATVAGDATLSLEVPLDQVLPQSSPDTIETWDSIHHLNMVLALEQEFGIQFSPEEIEQLLSVELIVALVAEKTAVVENA